MVIFLSGVFLDASYAQPGVNITKEVTLTGNLENNPVAQDILAKIELTKQWIKELEQREYEKLQAQKELEEKRSQALASLHEDLKDWEELWEKFTFEYRFKKLSENMLPGTSPGVFWDQQNFTYTKILAGREALKNVLADGGTFEEARHAYIKAAEIKRIEMIEINSQSNVNHNLAYYEQQLLFNSKGQFVPTSHNLAKLSEYYTDYRLDPQYVLANPYDDYANDSTKADPDRQCRAGDVLVHRAPSNDYACVTKATAQKWARYNIGDIIGEAKDPRDENSLTPDVKTNPNTKCRQDHIVIYYNAIQDYSCVLAATARMLIDEGKAETHSLVTFIQHKEHNLETQNEVYDVNQEILYINKDYDVKYIELTHKYDTEYRALDSQQRKEEMRVANLNFDSSTSEELSEMVLQVRGSFEPKKEKVLQEKEAALDDIKEEYDSKILSIKREYRDSEEIKIVFNSDSLHYEAVRI